MKPFVLTGMAMVGFTLATLGQSWIYVDNTVSIGGVTIDTAGNYYNGPYGVEVWAKPGAIGDNINSFNGQAGGANTAYGSLAADGYVLGGTFANKNMRDGWFINAGEAYWPNFNMGYYAVAVVVWNSSAGSFSAAVTGGSKAGVYTFISFLFYDTHDNAPITLGDFWGTTDLVMTTVPEPGMFALVGLGGAALLIFHIFGLMRRHT
jgi:hypothetical protein